MQDFAAIDLETVNERRSCVCSIGVVIVRFCQQFLPDGTPPRRPGQQQTSSGGEKYSGLASKLAHLGRIC